MIAQFFSNGIFVDYETLNDAYADFCAMDAHSMSPLEYELKVTEWFSLAKIALEVVIDLNKNAKTSAIKLGLSYKDDKIPVCLIVKAMSIIYDSNYHKDVVGFLESLGGMYVEVL